MDAASCTISHDCRWHTTNRFHYRYPAPVSRVLTRLRLLPRPHHGAQQVAHASLSIDPLPRAARSWIDAFGNCVVEVEHTRLATELEITAEACITVSEEAAGTLREPDEAALREARQLYLSATRLVDRNPEIEALATSLRRRGGSDETLAWECMQTVYREMTYLPGSTSVTTRASGALAQGYGVCQDFAQVMLALLRAAGLPARYVSGHIEGEGQMHAWVEVLHAPAAGGPVEHPPRRKSGACGGALSEQPAWRAYDPTHGRLAGEGYVTVAVGRDYADVAPISGRCYGPYPGRLSSRQHMRRSASEVAACA